VRFPFEVVLKRKDVDGAVRRALREDVDRGDVTTIATVGPRVRARAELRLKSDGVVAGLAVFAAAFKIKDRGVKVRFAGREGGRYRAGRVLANVEGRARSMLTCERVALNFIQRLSGIATHTRRFVDEVRGTGVKIVDTRKTTPGLRLLEKYAVLAGGGFNHRLSLSDLALIKDNHIKAAGGIAEAVARMRASGARVPVEIEVGPEVHLEDLRGVRVDVIMLDNWPLRRLKYGIEIVRTFPARPVIEVSGGITLKNVGRIARCGPDVISIGELTHSAPSLDLSLDFKG